MTLKAGATEDKFEIERFNQLATTWWNPEGPMWPLHLLNQFRVEVILDVLHKQGIISPINTKPLEGMSVLDIGCGGGILSESLCKLGAEVTGLDLAKNNISIAMQHAQKANLDIQYLCAEIGTVEKQFDLVFNMEVVEHVADLDSFMKASCLRVNRGGCLFLSTINKTMKSYLFAIIGAEYILQLLPRGTHQWSKFVTPETLQDITTQHGLQTVWQSGISLNPFNKHYKLVQSMAVNYMMATHRP